MKSMKTLVLAALILLASVVVLAGCDTPLEPESTTANEQAGGSENDSVPEVTPAKRVSITVTPPTRTVYSVGEPFDGSGMVVTATYEDGETREVTGWTTNFDEVTREKGVNKKVTVSYTEGDNTVTASFTVDVVDPSVPTILTSYISPNHTDDTWTYVAFGEWPQTIKAAGVTVDKIKSRKMGMFTAYLGSDGNYYVEAEEWALGAGSEYKYSDGTQAGQNGTSKKWFKVEPIVWRVLTEDYKVPGENEELQSTGKALLLAENILTGGIPYYSVYNVTRTIEGAQISPNNYEHSQIRAFLNGLSYEYKESVSAEQIQKSEYKDAGFLQTAFTTEAQKFITPTTVDNSVTSTLPNTLTEEQKTTNWKNGENEYACGNTTDKIFLLSEQEATKSDYGFDKYDVRGSGNTRIRVTTDYAKATGAYQSATAGYGGWWWLRSPYYNGETNARCINNGGHAGSRSLVRNVDAGVVPALSISINGN